MIHYGENINKLQLSLIVICQLRWCNTDIDESSCIISGGMNIIENEKTWIIVIYITYPTYSRPVLNPDVFNMTRNLVGPWNLFTIVSDNILYTSQCNKFQMYDQGPDTDTQKVLVMYLNVNSCSQCYSTIVVYTLVMTEWIPEDMETPRLFVLVRACPPQISYELCFGVKSNLKTNTAHDLLSQNSRSCMCMYVVK
jgi:hypothetical protein